MRGGCFAALPHSFRNKKERAPALRSLFYSVVRKLDSCFSPFLISRHNNSVCIPETEDLGNIILADNRASFPVVLIVAYPLFFRHFSPIATTMATNAAHTEYLEIFRFLYFLHNLCAGSYLTYLELFHSRFSFRYLLLLRA